ncbi:biopolymer transporter ExbD [Pseudoluteimonas lycopersici]|uniref:Biopolymer transporter ExbD n=1 Tax=Pseudoluteimonas lycopersici TaxID=1324796 RepID=A0A516V6A9_9GAMM|nr:biopolymer transporter ExbD [Lysobacter lycopersici]QDQ74053.1 biopolymer transporter ExbD [Lysobacter lycopersici]
MAFANRDAALPVAAINITPLVDVLLVLLVIFMVTAPVLARSIDVRLPQSVDKAPKPALQLQLRVDAAGGYWLDNAAIERSALVAALRAATERDPGLQLVLRSDDDGDYQGFVSALSAAREAGIQGIATPR